MKIEIHNPINPADGYTVYFDGNKRLPRYRPGIKPTQWEESEIEILLGDMYPKFEAGQYSFNIPAWKIHLLTGKKPAQTNEQLRFLTALNEA